jgi:hypothetical protein
METLVKLGSDGVMARASLQAIVHLVCTTPFVYNKGVEQTLLQMPCTILVAICQDQPALTKRSY